MSDDVVAELDWLAGLFTAARSERAVAQRARDEIVALRAQLEAVAPLRIAIADALAAARREARAEALEEAALIVDRHPDASRHRDSELIRGCCEVMAADIRALKDKRHD